MPRCSLLVDDDMIVDKLWLREHLRSHLELNVDVVNGRIYGTREKITHGARLKKCGTTNVSFARRLVDPGGLGLRFDQAFNELGTEDQAFFRSAMALGVVIRQSDFPLVYNYYGRDAAPEEEVINKMLTTAAMQHNLVAVARREMGLLGAALRASKGVLFGVQGSGPPRCQQGAARHAADLEIAEIGAFRAKAVSEDAGALCGPFRRNRETSGHAPIRPLRELTPP